MKPAILTNLRLCFGCWTCSLGCQQGKKLADDKWIMRINTVGSESGKMDEPAGSWADPSSLKMSWVPVAFPTCNLCKERTDRGKEPYCTYNCPSLARIYGDLDDPTSKISLAMKDLSGRGYKIYQLPDAGDKTHAAFYYADKEAPQRIG